MVIFTTLTVIWFTTPQQTQPQQKQRFQIRKGAAQSSTGGSRRKNSRRLRRKQRGGLEPFTTALVLTGFVFACVAMVGFFVYMNRKPDYTRG